MTSHESMAVTGTVGIASHVPKFCCPKLDVETLLDRRFSVGVGGGEFVWIRRLLSAHNLNFSDLHPLGVQSKRQRRAVLSLHSLIASILGLIFFGRDSLISDNFQPRCLLFGKNLAAPLLRRVSCLTRKSCCILSDIPSSLRNS